MNVPAVTSAVRRPPLASRSRTAGQLVRYGVVGIASNAALYAAYLGLTALGVGSKTAMTVLYALGTAATFAFNSAWTFGRAPHARWRIGAFARYVSSYAVGYVVNFALLALLVDRLGWPHHLVQAASVITVAMLLFTLQKFWVFADRAAPTPMP